MPKILDGKSLARRIEEGLKTRVEILKSKLGFTPKLATILVGDFPPSITYVNMKKKACERIGLESEIVKMSENTTTNQLLGKIQELNGDKNVCGILLQHPVPKQIDERACFDAIALEKDVDGVNSASYGGVAMGKRAFKCATPMGIVTLLKEYNIPLAGKRAVIVGRSAILGKPLAQLLMNEDCTVTVCHSKTEDLPKVVKKGDIVVGAVGKPNFITKDMVRKGVVLVDAGYNKGNVGDIDLENCKNKCSAYTPVPGGVGPMTIASLLTQTVEAAEKLVEKKDKSLR